MARTLSRNERNYAPGTFGPFNVDSFTSANTEKLVLDIVPDVDTWPTDEAVLIMTVTVLWDNGSGAIFTVNGSPGNPPFKGGGPPHPIMIIHVPNENDGSGGKRKQQVVGGTASVVIHTACRFAFTLRAE